MTLKEIELHNSISLEQLDQEELNELIEVAEFDWVGGNLFNVPAERFQDYTGKYIVAVASMQGAFFCTAFTNKNRLYNILERLHTNGFDITASIIGVRV